MNDLMGFLLFNNRRIASSWTFLKFVLKCFVSIWIFSILLKFEHLTTKKLWTLNVPPGIMSPSSLAPLFSVSLPPRHFFHKCVEGPLNFVEERKQCALPLLFLPFVLYHLWKGIFKLRRQVNSLWILLNADFGLQGWTVLHYIRHPGVQALLLHRLKL